MENFIEAETAKLAGLQIDMLSKLRSGQLTLAQLEWWLNRQNNFRDKLIRGELVISEPAPKLAPTALQFLLKNEWLHFTPNGFFKSEILPADPKIRQIGLVDHVPSHTLQRDMTDDEILSEFGDGHVFENNREFCLVLYTMIYRWITGCQAMHKRELLSNPGYFNVFHVIGESGDIFSVIFTLHDSNTVWLVSAHPLCVFTHSADSRIFSRRDFFKKK